MGRSLTSLRVTLDVTVDFEQKSDKLPLLNRVVYMRFLAWLGPAAFLCPKETHGHYINYETVDGWLELLIWLALS